MKNTLLLIIVTIQLGIFTSHAEPLVDENFKASLSVNGRVGLHGMVVFGTGMYYMSHIPMLGMPHDIQVVSSVSLIDSNGNDVTAALSNDTFTIRPTSRFSLNNFAKGTLKEFKGSVYLGSFEMGGSVVEGLNNVTVTVDTQIVVRQLPSESVHASVSLADGADGFSVNIITPARNFQEVLKGGKRLWCVLGPDFFSPCRQ